jgi:hypothetical protein
MSGTTLCDLNAEDGNRHFSILSHFLCECESHSAPSHLGSRVSDRNNEDGNEAIEFGFSDVPIGTAGVYPRHLTK